MLLFKKYFNCQTVSSPWMELHWSAIRKLAVIFDQDMIFNLHDKQMSSDVLLVGRFWGEPV